MDLLDDSLVPKLCGIVILSFTSVAIGLLPMMVQLHYKPNTNHIGQKKRYKRLLAHMSAFGGGVLLSTTFLHLLPEIRKSVEQMRSKNLLKYKESIQFPELLMCLGFLFLYLIEEVGHTIMSSRNRLELGQVYADQLVATYDSVMEVISPDVPETNIDKQCGNGVSSEVSEKQIADTKHSGNGDDRNGLQLQEDRLSRHNDSMIFFTESSGRNFLLIFALSVHEGFEGLAIGLERQPDAVWYMILGVGSHKAVIAFCIGVQMLSSKLNRKVAIIYIFMFAAATSFGITIGMFLSMESGIFSVILQGLATGTLLHVVFFELLKPHSGHTPFAGVFFGFTSMAVLKYFSP